MEWAFTNESNQRLNPDTGMEKLNGMGGYKIAPP